MGLFHKSSSNITDDNDNIDPKFSVTTSSYSIYTTLKKGPALPLFLLVQLIWKSPLKVSLNMQGTLELYFLKILERPMSALSSAALWMAKQMKALKKF